MVSVDPVTLAVVRDAIWGAYPVTSIYDLHQQLLIPAARGRPLMGVVGLGLVVLLTAGIVIWWPKPGGWLRNLGFSHPASTPRRMLEIHQVAGVYGGLLLVAMVMTGVMICLPDQARLAVSAFSAPVAFPQVRSTLHPGAARISFDQAAAVARARFPEARVVWMDAPQGAPGVFQIRLRQPEEPSSRFPRTYAWVDQYSGRVLASRTSRAEGAGDRLLTWLHPLHNGEAFGMAGRLIVCLLGFLPTVLFVTGLWRWLRVRGRPKAA
jgi:uncharacterized iron-regulated membrane protein